jgi:hypothetical protein
MVLMKLAMQQQHCRSSCESCLAKGPALAKGGTMMHCPDVAGTFLRYGLFLETRKHNRGGLVAEAASVAQQALQMVFRRRQ